LCYNRAVKKRKKGAANGKAPARKPGLAVEITGIVLLFFALFSLVSLISYDSRDPSFANTAASGHHVSNFAGRIGAYFAGSLLVSGLRRFSSAVRPGVRSR
jgi:hypothetical protein